MATAKITLSISESSVNTANNTSVVTAKLYYYGNGVSWNNGGCSGNIVIAGTTYSFKGKTISKSTSAQLIHTASKTVTHNSNGAYTVSVSGRLATDTSAVGTLTTSASKALTTINRKSTISLSSAEIFANNTEEVTVNIGKRNSSFYDIVTVTLGSETATYTVGTGTSTKIKIPLSWNNQIPNDNSATATVTTTTKTSSSGTSLGSSSVSLKVKVPTTAEFNPKVTITATDPNGYKDKFGKYLVGLSKVKVTGTETGQYGATIASRKIEVNGTSYTSNPATSGILSSANNTSITYTVTDTRGKSTTAKATISTYAYSSPKITAHIVPTRWSTNTSSGVAQNNGNYAKVGFTFSVDTGLSGNAIKSAKIISKATGATTDTELTTTSAATKFISAPHDKTISITYYVQDTVGQIARMSYTLPTASAILSSRKGYQFAIGKIAEKGTNTRPAVEIDWDTYMNKKLYVGDIDYTITDAEYDELLSLLGGVVRLIDWIYPIGAVVASVNPDYDPNKIFKTHTWERFAKGQTLVGANESDTDFATAGKTGGEKKHKLTVTEMPSHGNHLFRGTMYSEIDNFSDELSVPTTGKTYYLNMGNMATAATSTANRGWKNWNGGEFYPTGKLVGGGTAHNNLQPYTTVYYWKRTA